MGNIRLVVSDLDGCLLDGEGKLPGDFDRTLSLMRVHGVTFAAASGRAVQGITSLIRPDPDIAMITDNGSCGYLGQKLLWSDMLKKNVWYPIIRRARQIPGLICVGCGLQDAWIEHPERMSEKTCREMRRYYPSWSHLDFDAYNGDLIKAAFFYEGNIEKDVYPLVRDLENDQLTVRVTAYTWIDLFGSRVSKGTGVEKLQKKLGIGREETVVFGDYLNDLPMAEHAALSFAPENAHPEVRERFSRVIGSNRDGAVTRTIQELLG